MRESVKVFAYLDPCYHGSVFIFLDFDRGWLLHGYEDGHQSSQFPVQEFVASACKTAQIAIDKSGDLSPGPLLNCAAIP